MPCYFKTIEFSPQMCPIENTKGNVAKKKKRGEGERIKLYIYIIYNIYIYIFFFSSLWDSLLTEKNPTYGPEEEEVGKAQEMEEAPTSPPMSPRSCLRSALYQFGEVARALCLPDVRPH